MKFYDFSKISERFLKILKIRDDKLPYDINKIEDVGKIFKKLHKDTYHFK